MTSPETSGSHTNQDARLRLLLEEWYRQLEVGSDPDVEFLNGEDPALVRRFNRVVGRSLDLVCAVQPDPKPSPGEGAPPVDRLGPYRLVELLGVGGMSRVYLAEEEGLGREVAIKVFEVGVSGSPSAQARFRREAEITAALDHPNVVPIYSVGSEGAWHYIAMKRIRGASLAEERGLAPKEAARIGARIARALHEAHTCGVVHRDVKPSNVMMDGEAPMLLDFGLARPLTGPSLTEGSAVPGTLLYMSPEQLERGSVDTRTDVYSLGATLYETILGAPPYDASSTSDALIRQILHRDPPRLRLSRADRDLEVIIQRAMEKEPDARFTTAEEMAEDLERYLSATPIRSRPCGLVGRAWKLARRHRRAALVCATLLVLLVGATWALVSQSLDARRRRNRDLTRIDAKIAAFELRGAEDLLRPLERGDPDAPDVRERREHLDARRALEDLLEGLNDLTLVRAPGEYGKLLALVDRHARRLPQPITDVARALTCHHLGERGRSFALLDGLEARRRTRVTAALRQLFAPRDKAAWELPPAATEGSAAERAEAHVLVAMAMKLGGRPPKEQEPELRQAFALAPTSYRVRLARARLLADSGRHAHALGILENVFLEGRLRPVTHYGLAHTCVELGDLDGARAWLKKAPADHEHILRASVVANLMNREGSAELADHLERALHRWPGDPEFHRMLGGLRFREGRVDDALSHFRAALKRPSTQEMRDLLELRCLQVRMQREPDAARDLVAIRKLRQRTSSKTVRAEADYVAYFLQTDDSPAKARAALRRSVRTDPRNVPAVFSLAIDVQGRLVDVFKAEGLDAVPPRLRKEARQALDHLESLLDGPGVPPDRRAEGCFLAVYLAAALPTRERMDAAAARFATTGNGDVDYTDAIASLSARHPYGK